MWGAIGEMKPPILITGAARSGTSMSAGTVELSGAFGGITSPPNSNNEKGMFENSVIRDTLVKGWLRGKGFDPMGQNPLPSEAHLKDITKADGLRWREKVLDVLVAQGLTEDMQWYYKGAKMCLMWPLWVHAFPEAKWLIVRRRKRDIVDSCMRTGFMRAHRSEEGWASWVNQHILRFAAMAEHHIKVKEVWPEKMIHGDFEEMREAIDWLGLEWDAPAVVDFISPKLWNKGIGNGS